jgi:UDPglucose--hexose-1-phosphate uridylyltransferase
MPELRRDPIVDRWVIIAPDRARRPAELCAPVERASGGACPFCPGHEDKTPPELLAVRPHDGPGAQRNRPGWSLRVFPNRQPALGIEGNLDAEGHGLYDRMNGIGAHEVIVETADHGRRLADLARGEVSNLVDAYRARILDLKRDMRFRYVMVFKNQGAAAGAALDHAHSQLIALPTVPKTVSDEMHGARSYWRYKERCVFCDIVRQETREAARLVYENAEMIVVEPYAARFPFETWILPRRHRAAFETCHRGELDALADALRTTLGLLRRALDDPPYNYMLHSAPFREEESPSYHWHVEIMPTLAKVAGFEWGSGFHINPTPPEEAARFLRDLETA